MKFAIVWPDQMMPVASDGKHVGRQLSGIFARCMSPELALFGHPTRADECPLSGVKRI
jgi:hypothetical protein